MSTDMNKKTANVCFSSKTFQTFIVGSDARNPPYLLAKWVG